MDKNDFNPTIKPKMSAENYIIHLRSVHKVIEGSDIPMGADALFGNHVTYISNSTYSTSTGVPSEPIEIYDDWFTKEKQKGYSLGAQ
ncbi:MAG: hypothetical protein WA139_03995 [Candidatus Aenigmatarchaeota archaeon]